MERNAMLVRFVSPLAAELADWASLRQDLSDTAAICQRLMELLSTPEPDEYLSDALWSAALVRYARCFATGKRKRLSPEVVAHLPGDPIATHEYYVNQRDKLIAHSVNPFEEASVGVLLPDPEDPSQIVLGVAEIHVRLISNDLAGVSQLASLANAVLAVVELEIVALRERLLVEAGAVPMEDLRKLEILSYLVPGAKAASRARK